MSNDRPLDLPGEQTSLSVKITVIVFWGMFAAGLLIAIPLLHGLERDFADHQSAVARRAAGATELFLLRHPDADLDEIARATRDVTAEDGARGFTLQRGRERVVQGDIEHGRHNVTTRTIPGVSGAGPGSEPLRFELYQADIAQSVAEKRKGILIRLGGLLLLFGALFGWVFHQVLHRPILHMIAAVSAFSGGETARRLDEQRPDELGYLARFVNQALDLMTRRQQELREASESALFTERERAEVTLHSIGDAVITTDAAGHIDYLNPVAAQLTGLDAAQARGRDIGDALTLVDEFSRQRLENPVTRCLRHGHPTETPQQVVLVRADGTDADISCSVSPIRDRAGAVVGAVLVFHDVGHTRRLTRQLSYQAAHDALTGLYNRQEFDRHLRETLAEGPGSEWDHAVCFIDMDQFKIVNDTCGHAAGDEMLRRFSVLLKEHLRGSDIVARLGGDEFGILLKSCTAAQAETIVQKFLDKVRQTTFAWETRSFRFGASIGLVALPPGQHVPADVLSMADVACYAAKDGGRNRVHLYRPDDQDLHRRRTDMHWVSRIQSGLQQNRFQLFAQPVVWTGRPDAPVEYYELLLRFLDEGGQLIPPAAFLPAAERYQLMPQIDRWVIAAAFDLFQSPPLRAVVGRIGINLSGLSLSDEDLLHYTLDRLNHTGIAPQRVCFEITETAMVSNFERAQTFVQTLRARGCTFALDDFGSGLSSFNYLKQLQVDYLKIDGTFVKNMSCDLLDRATVAAIHGVGTATGIRTIAECVEDSDTIETLKKIGVDLIQGYGIARPAPIEKLLPRRSRAAAR